MDNPRVYRVFATVTLAFAIYVAGDLWRGSNPAVFAFEYLFGTAAVVLVEIVRSWLRPAKGIDVSANR